MKRINLIKWQAENGYTSKFVAQKLGISQSSYSQLKNGKTKPTIDLAYKFNEIFKIEDVLELLKK